MIKKKYEGRDAIEVRDHAISTRLVTVLESISPEAELDATLDNLERIKALILGTILTAFDYQKSEKRWK